MARDYAGMRRRSAPTHSRKSACRRMCGDSSETILDSCPGASLCRGGHFAEPSPGLGQMPWDRSVANENGRYIMIATSSSALSAEAIQGLAGAFQGELIQPGDPTYDEARKVWNG